MAPRTNSRRRSAATYGMAIGVLVVVAGLIVAVLFVSRLRHRAGQGGARPAEPKGAVAEADPFASLPTSESAGSSDRRLLDQRVMIETHTGIVDPFTVLDRDPFGEVLDERRRTLKPEPGQLTGSDLWQEALELASRVGGRLMLATEAREKGDAAREKSHRREAVSALDQALEKTQRWTDEEVSRFDPDDLQVRAVHRLRKQWREQADRLRAQDAR